MIRTVRQQFISRGLIKVLLSAGGAPVTEEVVYDRTIHHVGPPLVTRSEFEETLRYHDAAGHLTSVVNDDGTKYAINDQGRIWAIDHRV